MAQWTDANGVHHNTDNLEYGNQGDTNYWEGTPGAVGSVSYDRPQGDDGAQANFVVTNTAVPSITAATEDTAAASQAAAQSLQRAREAAAAAQAASSEQARQAAQAQADIARAAANRAMDAAARASRAQASAQRGQATTYVQGEIDRMLHLFGSASALAQSQIRQGGYSTAAEQEQARIAAEMAQHQAETAAAAAKARASGQNPAGAAPALTDPLNTGPAGESGFGYPGGSIGSVLPEEVAAVLPAKNDAMLWIGAGVAALLLLGRRR